MRRAFSLLACLALASCGDVPPIVAPTPPVVPLVPARITITATPGIGVNAGEVYIAARVLATSGAGVGAAPVAFSTNLGTVAPAAVVADGGGIAQTTVRTSGPSSVRVVSGTAEATIDITPNPPITLPAPVPPEIPTTPPPVVLPPSVPPPTPPPTPQPTPTPLPPAGLQLSLGCSTSVLTVGCNLAASYNGVPLQSTAPTFVQVDWDWGDGTSQIVAGSPLGSHPYAQAGTYSLVAHATVTTVDGVKLGSASQAVKVP